MLSYEQAALALNNYASYVTTSKSSLSPGDLIFWQTSETKNCVSSPCPHYIRDSKGTQYHVHHVGIYMGNDQVVEAVETYSTSLVRNIIPDSSAFEFVFGINLLDHYNPTLHASNEAAVEETVYVELTESLDPTLYAANGLSADDAPVALSYADTFVRHIHTDDCIDSQGVLACGYVEGAYYHVHNS